MKMLMVKMMIECYITTQPFTPDEIKDFQELVNNYVFEFSNLTYIKYTLESTSDEVAYLIYNQKVKIKTNEECWIKTDNIQELLFYIYLQESFPKHISIVYEDYDITFSESTSELTWKKSSTIETYCDDSEKKLMDAIISLLKTNSRNCIILNTDLESNTIKSFYF